MGIEIITTSDGSHSLFNHELDETYHSKHGAVQESMHVFIKEGLNHYIEKNSPSAISVLEIGFGTGLNALLTGQRAEQLSRHIAYTSLETHPVPEAIWSQLNYAEKANDFFRDLHHAAWNEKVLISTLFTLHKLKTSLQLAELASSEFDIIYYDAFAPSKQPELWEFPMLDKVVTALKPNGVFVTYCAKGQLKRDLKTLGLSVETLNGPPGKKEMVRGIKIH